MKFKTTFKEHQSVEEAMIFRERIPPGSRNWPKSTTTMVPLHGDQVSHNGECVVDVGSNPANHASCHNNTRSYDTKHHQCVSSRQQSLWRIYKKRGIAAADKQLWPGYICSTSRVQNVSIVCAVSGSGLRITDLTLDKLRAIEVMWRRVRGLSRQQGRAQHSTAQHDSLLPLPLH